MARIGFVVHGQRERARLLAKETAEWLADEGHRGELLEDRPLPEMDLAVSLGGDGTMLRTVDLVCDQGIPVLGVNVGHLGYLTAVEPEDLRHALTRFLTGDYQIDARMTLDVRTEKSEEPRTALNDVVLQRTSVGHTMNTEVWVNGVPFLTFASDSLILATPTGSTAYNLSARGPIVSPQARVQVLTPVAPHMLFDRSLVLDAKETISIVPTGDQPVDVVVDGWKAVTLPPGQSISCTCGAHDALLVTFGERNFHRILKTKFNLSDR